MENAKKILIIRFSSFGDIVHCMSVINPLRERYPTSEIHWLCRSDFASLLGSEGGISKIWSFERKAGLLGLMKLAITLSSENFNIIYDAHSNLRSRVVCWVLGLFGTGHQFFRRPKSRLKRFLLFKFGINKFPWPFKAMHSYIDPLTPLGLKKDLSLTQTWNFPDSAIEKVNGLASQIEKKIILVPSAAHELKRWPVSHWIDLIKKLPDYNFIILGGPEDKFCQEIASAASSRVENLAGKLSLEESSYVVSKSPLIISGDTGLLQVADLLGRATIALIGPTAFGFPTGEQVKTMSVPLDCRPCTKDGSGNKCKNTLYQRCMVEISPDNVSQKAETIYDS